MAINRQTQQTQTDCAHLCLGIGRSNDCMYACVCAHIIWKRACEMRSETRKWLLVVNLWTTATNQCQLEVSLLGARKWWANQVTRAGPSTSSNRIETESCLYFNNIIYVHVFAFNRNQKRSESKANNASREKRNNSKGMGEWGMRGEGEVWAEQQLKIC